MDHKTATYTSVTTRRWHKLFLCAGLVAALGMEECTLGLVSIESPTDGTTFTAAQTVTITASALEGEGLVVEEVRFHRNGDEVGTDVTPPYTYRWPITDRDNGTHRFHAEARYRRNDGTTELLQSEEVAYEVAVTSPEGQGAQLLGSISGLDVRPTDVEIAQDQGLALLTSYRDLVAVDIRDAENPTVTNEFSGVFYSLAVGSSAAYAVRAIDSLRAELVVLELRRGSASIASRVELTKGHAGSSPGNELAVRDGFLYVAATKSGLEIFDVSNPLAPSLVSTTSLGAPGVPLGRRPNSVAIDDNYVYVGLLDKIWPLLVYDIRDKRNPVFVEKHLGSDIRGIEVEGDHGYYFMGSGTLRGKDLLDSSSKSWNNGIRGTTDISVSNGILAAALPDTVTLYDLSTPTSPRVIEELGTPSVLAIDMKDGVMLTADNQGTLRIYSLD